MFCVIMFLQKVNPRPNESREYKILPLWRDCLGWNTCINIYIYNIYIIHIYVVVEAYSIVVR